MGIPKCFNFLGCLEVTLILRDYKTVTGKIVGDLKDDRKKYDDFDCCKKDDHKKDECKKDDHDKCHHEKDDKCCEPPKVDVNVNVDDKCDFILLELTRDAQSVSILEVEGEDENEIEIEVANVEFRRGSCIAVNVCDIIYAGVNAEIEEEEIEIDLEDIVNSAAAGATPPEPEPTPTPTP